VHKLLIRDKKDHLIENVLKYSNER